MKLDYLELGIASFAALIIVKSVGRDEMLEAYAARDRARITLKSMFF
jgi:hypothetical protein